MMRIAFRVDASLQMGIGHVMRCLTLADALSTKGTECHFICREHPGNRIVLLREHGHHVHILPINEQNYDACENITVRGNINYAHSHWLGVAWQVDADQTVSILKVLNADWLVVDHYALDSRWESNVRQNIKNLMVIDDLADRTHNCDLLLDQTFGRAKEHYRSLVNQHCTLLTGSKYALLRPEFAALRAYSLRRRKKPTLKHILITMGGVDQYNATGRVLDIINHNQLPDNCHVSVVLGDMSPWLDTVRRQIGHMRRTTRILTNVNNMAELMADSDLCIGAAGTTSWERCSLGLPSIVVVLADNQRFVAQALEADGAAWVIYELSAIGTQLPRLLDQQIISLDRLKVMSQAASRITDGNGISSVMNYII